MKRYVLLVIVLFPSLIIAETGESYFGGGYHSGKYEEDGVPNANLPALKVEYGKYITDVVSVEGHFLLGIGDDTVSVLGEDVDIEVKQAISIFLKGDLNLNENVNLYGLVGFSKGKLEASVLGSTISEDDSGLSYGFGVESITLNRLIISAEYIFYLSEDTYDYSGFNLGIARKF